MEGLEVMNIVTNQLENGKIKITVDVDENKWLDAQNKTKKKIYENIEVDGFRKGHVPDNIASKHVDSNKVFDEAINLILPSVFDEVVVSSKINPLTRPEINIEKFSTTSLTINFILNVVPKIEIKNYKNIGLKKEMIEVTDDEVNKSINQLLERYSELKTKNDKAIKGDIVVLNFEGFIDKKPFDGGKASNYELTLGSNQFVPGFEDQLIGVKANEDKEIEVVFPENYVTEFKGKKAVFKCHINEVKEKIIPKLSEEIIKKISIKNVKTIEDLKKYQKDFIRKDKEIRCENSFYQKLIDEIIKNNKIDVNDEIINERVSLMKDDVTERIKQSGLELKQYLNIIGKTEEDMIKDLKNDAKKNIYETIIIDSILEKENVVVSDDEIENECNLIAEKHNLKKDKINKNFVINKIKSDKLRKLLLEFNK